MNKKLFATLKITIFIIFFILVDQLTKYIAKVHLAGKDKEITLIRNVLSINYLDGGNRGAAWGMLYGKITLLIVFTIIVVTIISIFIRNTQVIIDCNYSLKIKTIAFLKYLFALLIAGAFGNIIDRICYGYVIDFIEFKFISFPIFNVADICVSVACFFIVIICIFRLKEKEFNMIFSFKNPKNKIKE